MSESSVESVTDWQELMTKELKLSRFCKTLPSNNCGKFSRSVSPIVQKHYLWYTDHKSKFCECLVKISRRRMRGIFHNVAPTALKDLLFALVTSLRPGPRNDLSDSRYWKCWTLGIENHSGESRRKFVLEQCVHKLEQICLMSLQNVDQEAVNQKPIDHLSTKRLCVLLALDHHIFPVTFYRLLRHLLFAGGTDLLYTLVREYGVPQEKGKIFTATFTNWPLVCGCIWNPSSSFPLNGTALFHLNIPQLSDTTFQDTFGFLYWSLPCNWVADSALHQKASK